jgi:hypothetical protein
MPFENLNNNHYLASEKTSILAAVVSLENILSPKFKNLNPDERKKYGSITSKTN